ncbi:hypothetical protein, partial [Yoonia sp.]|uniref:hypothetical protein n=1 Tax=Yoonia sp. TaxID=2212373 RepID=UPI0025EC9426
VLFLVSSGHRRTLQRAVHERGVSDSTSRCARGPRLMPQGSWHHLPRPIHYSRTQYPSYGVFTGNIAVIAHVAPPAKARKHPPFPKPDSPAAFYIIP